VIRGIDEKNMESAFLVTFIAMLVTVYIYLIVLNQSDFISSIINKVDNNAGGSFTNGKNS